MGLSRIGPIHHSNVINTVTTTNDLLIMLLDSNFPMTNPLTVMVSVNTITSLVIKLATAGKDAFIIQLPTLLLQSIYRKILVGYATTVPSPTYLQHHGSSISLTTTLATDSKLVLVPA